MARLIKDQNSMDATTATAITLAPIEQSSRKRGYTERTKARARIEEKPSRGRSYVYVGMAMEKATRMNEADPVKLWQRAVRSEWAKAHPSKPLPDTLSLDNSLDRADIIEMVGRLCKEKNVALFRATELEKTLIGKEPKRKSGLFSKRDFLVLNLTTNTGEKMTIKTGLVALLAVAFGLDSYKEMHTKATVLKYYDLFPHM